MFLGDLVLAFRRKPILLNFIKWLFFRPKMVKYQQFHMVQSSEKELVFPLVFFFFFFKSRGSKCITYQEDFANIILDVEIYWDHQRPFDFYSYPLKNKRIDDSQTCHRMYKAYLYWVNYSKPFIKDMSGKYISIKLPLRHILSKIRWRIWVFRSWSGFRHGQKWLLRVSLKWRPTSRRQYHRVKVISKVNNLSDRFPYVSNKFIK